MGLLFSRFVQTATLTAQDRGSEEQTSDRRDPGQNAVDDLKTDGFKGSVRRCPSNGVNSAPLLAVIWGLTITEVL
jgi:hypothetical protein